MNVKDTAEFAVFIPILILVALLGAGIGTALGLWDIVSSMMPLKRAETA